MIYHTTRLGRIPKISGRGSNLKIKVPKRIRHWMEVSAFLPEKIRILCKSLHFRPFLLRKVMSSKWQSVHAYKCIHIQYRYKRPKTDSELPTSSTNVCVTSHTTGGRMYPSSHSGYPTWMRSVQHASKTEGQSAYVQIPLVLPCWKRAETQYL